METIAECEKQCEIKKRECESIVNGAETIYDTELSYPSKSLYSFVNEPPHSLKSFQLFNSTHTSFHTSRSVKSLAGIPVRRYSRPLRSISSYRSAQHVNVTRESIWRYYHITTGEQSAQRKQQQLENEIAYENVRAAALLEKRKAEIDADIKMQSAKRRLELSNKCVEIETERMILEEKRQLNEYEAQRAILCVKAGKPVP